MGHKTATIVICRAAGSAGIKNVFIAEGRWWVGGAMLSAFVASMLHDHAALNIMGGGAPQPTIYLCAAQPRPRRGW